MKGNAIREPRAGSRWTWRVGDVTMLGGRRVRFWKVAMLLFCFLVSQAGGGVQGTSWRARRASSTARQRACPRTHEWLCAMGALSCSCPLGWFTIGARLLVPLVRSGRTISISLTMAIVRTKRVSPHTPGLPGAFPQPIECSLHSFSARRGVSRGLPRQIEPGGELSRMGKPNAVGRIQRAVVHYSHTGTTGPGLPLGRVWAHRDALAEVYPCTSQRCCSYSVNVD